MSRIFYFNITYRCNNNCIFCAADHGFNNTNSEMTIDEFKETLDQNNVGALDRVIINGGEPTTHTHFFDFLKIAKEHNAYIDLYTNGVKLNDFEFAKKLLTYTPLLIRIPIFGATPEVHDKLTGMSGSFKNTMDGIRNLLSVKENLAVNIEIKLLLSKATSDENEKIYDYFNRNFTKECYFSFNPLLISNRVKQNADVMFESCTDSIQKEIPLIRRMKNDGWKVSLSLLPICVLPTEYRAGGVDRNISETYSSPSLVKNVENTYCSPKCKFCSLKEICAGFPSSYISFVGDDEVKPIYVKKFSKTKKSL